jgi:hypothetical protein
MGSLDSPLKISLPISAGSVQDGWRGVCQASTGGPRTGVSQLSGRRLERFQCSFGGELSLKKQEKLR